MSYVNIDQLKDRIALLSLHSQAGEDGREICIYRSKGYAWAKITFCSRVEQRAAAQTAEVRSKPNPIYKIVVRSIPSEEPLRTIRAIRWKGRVFDLIEPFAPHPCAPNYLQAFCTENKLGNQEELEERRSLDCDARENFSFFSENFLKKSEQGGCQRYQNVDSMKYKKSNLTKINSKQSVNVKKDDDLIAQCVENQGAKGRNQELENREGDDHAEN